MDLAALGLLKTGLEKRTKQTRQTREKGGFMQAYAMLINFSYAVVGGLVTLLFMILGYKIFDKMTHFDTAKELANGNQAVGMVMMGIFIGVGVAIGLVIGMGLN